MKPIYELAGKKYSNEQEIIEAGCYVIYWYCFDVRGRWRDIEHLMVEDDIWGYSYASGIIRGRYEPDLEILYLMKNSGNAWANWYIRYLVNV